MLPIAMDGYKSTWEMNLSFDGDLTGVDVCTYCDGVYLVTS